MLTSSLCGHACSWMLNHVQTKRSPHILINKTKNTMMVMFSHKSAYQSGNPSFETPKNPCQCILSSNQTQVSTAKTVSRLKAGLSKF